MTEEEKKAIEALKYLKEDKYILRSLRSKVKAYEDIDDNHECGYVLSQYEQDAIDTLLNLIEKLKKEIEEYKLLNANIEKANRIIEGKEEYIPKDKIREKLERLESQKENYKEQPLIYMLLKNQLKSLIEEE